MVRSSKSSAEHAAVRPDVAPGSRLARRRPSKPRLESVASSRRREESGPPTKPSIAPRAAAGVHRDAPPAASDLSFGLWEHGGPTRTYSRVLALAGAALGLASLVTAALGRAGELGQLVALVGLGLVLASVLLAVVLFRSFVARIDAIALEAQRKARALPDASAERPSDPLALLALSVGKMSDRIETLTRQIDQRGEEERARVDALVRERTRQLGEEIADLRRLLGPAKAFLSVDARGNIVGQSSSVVEGWLGPAPEHGHFWDYFDRGGAEVASRFEAAWRDMLAGVPSEIDLRRMPKSLALGDRYLALEYQAVQASDGQLERLIVLMTDITAGAAELSARV